MSAQLRRDFATAAADAAHCLIMCAPRPIPVHCTSAQTARDGCSRETAGGRLPYCPTLITRRGKRQTTNANPCKFAEID